MKYALTLTVHSNSARLLGLCLLCLLVAMMPAAGQEPDREDRRERNRDRFAIPDDATSNNNEMLKRILQTFPDSDTNKDGVLDAEEARNEIQRQRDRWREGRDNRRGRFDGKVIRDVAYGPNDLHTLDLYIPRSEDPVPLVVYFHGGEFISGDRRDFRDFSVRDILDAGIAVASVDYRLAREAPFPASFEDATAALQYLRYYAEDFGLAPERIALYGEDAGGNLALYLAMHDDLARELDEEEREDAEKHAERLAEELARAEEQAKEQGDESWQAPNAPTWEDARITEQSTRVLGVVARHPLASYDPRYWKERGLPLNRHERKLPLYLGLRELEPFDIPELIELVGELSPVELASSDDPPVLLLSKYTDLDITETTSWTIMARHPKQIQLLQSTIRQAGAKATIRYDEMPNDPGTDDEGFLIELLKK